MKAYERFLEYVAIHTTSDPANEDGHPSSERQYDLACKLADEMRLIGMEEVYLDRDTCYVYGFIPASPGCEAAPGLGFIAHMDTSPDAPGENVLPMLTPAYDGGDVTLANGRVIDVATFTELPALKGQTLITASGNTLLGADDKAGIAEIMTACEQVLRGESPARHGKICVAFTPDEEIGSGARDFDFERFGAAYAYTVDGGAVEEFEYENFNAAAAKLRFTGVAVHPGSAKGVMVNAARLVAELDAMLPEDERPENTENRQGFFHLTDICGGVADAQAEYIIRDHDRALFEEKKQTMQKAADALNQKYGAGTVELELTDSYYNMGEVIEKHYHLVENAQKAMKAAGLQPKVVPVRGGTDGSRLSFAGLPCPNLGTGGHYFHGPNECITTEAMDKAVEVIVNLMELYA